MDNYIKQMLHKTLFGKVSFYFVHKGFKKHSLAKNALCKKASKIIHEYIKPEEIELNKLKDNVQEWLPEK